MVEGVSQVQFWSKLQHFILFIIHFIILCKNPQENIVIINLLYKTHDDFIMIYCYRLNKLIYASSTFAFDAFSKLHLVHNTYFYWSNKWKSTKSEHSGWCFVPSLIAFTGKKTNAALAGHFSSITAWTLDAEADLNVLYVVVFSPDNVWDEKWGNHAI